MYVEWVPDFFIVYIMRVAKFCYFKACRILSRGT